MNELSDSQTEGIRIAHNRVNLDEGSDKLNVVRDNKIAIWKPLTTYKKQSNSNDGDMLLPPPRIHAAITNSREHVFIYGGRDANSKLYNDLWLFDFSKQKWLQLNVESFNKQDVEFKREPGSREGHSLNYFRHRLYLFGGVIENREMADSGLIDNEDLKITPKRTDGLINNSSFKYSQGIWVYNIAKLRWNFRTLSVDSTSTESPCLRAYHCSTILSDGRLFLWGGCYESPGTLWSLDLRKSVWKREFPRLSSDHHTKSSNAPVARQLSIGHQLLNKFWIFGGVAINPDGSRGRLLSDLWYFDLENPSWTQIQEKGLWPNPRAGCASTILNDSSFVIQGGGHSPDFEMTNLNTRVPFGDAWMFSVLSQRWVQINDPSVLWIHALRWGHSLVTLPHPPATHLSSPQNDSYLDQSKTGPYRSDGKDTTLPRKDSINILVIGGVCLVPTAVV